MKIFDKIRGVKNGEWILLLFAVGILLVYFASGGISTASETGGSEGRLAKVLSSIEGAGEVEVFISYYEEQNAAYAFSINEAEKKEGEIKGVVIIAAGAGDPLVKLKLAEAARTALGVDASSVSVYKMEGK